MKKLFIILLLPFFLISCGNKTNCDFSQIKLVGYVDGNEVKTNQADGCFSITKSGEGKLTLYTIKDNKEDRGFSLSYYKEGNTIQTKNGKAELLRFLNVDFKNSSNKWRANKGHKIYKIEKPHQLAFYFSEQAKKKKSISGVIVFAK